MPAATVVYKPLDGGVGCDFIPARNRLVFVEFDGELDALDFVGMTPHYRFLGDGYQQPEDIAVTAGGNIAYVTERTGHFLRVDLNNAGRALAQVVTSGLNAPHQIVLDEANSEAYVVEFHDPGRLLRINLTNGTYKVITNALKWAIGLAVTSDRKTAYVSEQVPAGRIRKVDLTTGHVSDYVLGLVNPFFLTWVNSSEDGLFVPERDPANRIALVTVGGPPTILHPVQPTGFRPSSVAFMAPGRLLICCDGEIDGCDLGIIDNTKLLLGIGFVPFNAITATGFADTSALANYFYHVKHVPFAGTLPVMINHQKAHADNCKYYQILIDNTPRLDVWTDLMFNPVTQVFEPHTITPITLGGHAGLYPVRNPADLWYNPYLASLMSTLELTNSPPPPAPPNPHQLTVPFFNAAAQPVETSNLIHLHIDNNPCICVLGQPSISGTPADVNCGYLKYVNPTDIVEILYTAAQPQNHANYSFGVQRAIHSIFSQSGPVPGPGLFKETVQQMMACPQCPNQQPCTVAGFVANLYVTTTAINGWDRQSQYDRYLQTAFALAK